MQENAVATGKHGNWLLHGEGKNVDANEEQERESETARCYQVNKKATPDKVPGPDEMAHRILLLIPRYGVL